MVETRHPPTIDARPWAVARPMVMVTAQCGRGCGLDVAGDSRAYEGCSEPRPFVFGT